jgi:hypothetical protein
VTRGKKILPAIHKREMRLRLGQARLPSLRGLTKICWHGEIHDGIFHSTQGNFDLLEPGSRKRKNEAKARADIESAATEQTDVPTHSRRFRRS